MGKSKLTFCWSDERLTLTPTIDEYLFTQDTKILYYGDGITPGGKNVLLDELGNLFKRANTSGLAFYYNSDEQTLKAEFDVSEIKREIYKVRDDLITNIVSPMIQEAKHEISRIIENNIHNKFKNSIESLFSGTGGIGINGGIEQRLDKPESWARIYATVHNEYPPGIVQYTSRGTLTTPLSVQPGDLLHSFLTTAHDGNKYVLSSAIGQYVDYHGVVSSGTVPGKLLVVTFNDGDLKNPQGIAIDSRGYVSVNQVHSKASATLDINGFMKLSILSTEPENPSNGMIAIADGINWNPTFTGVQTVVVYLGDQWRTLAHS